MNVTPSQNQPQYRQTNANPAFKSLTIGLKDIPQKLQPTLVNAIKAQVGDGYEIILPELKQKGITKAFIGFNPEEIIIAINTAQAKIKRSVMLQLKQILDGLNIHNSEGILKNTGKDEINDIRRLTTVETNLGNDKYIAHNYGKIVDKYKYINTEHVGYTPKVSGIKNKKQSVLAQLGSALNLF